MSGPEVETEPVNIRFTQALTKLEQHSIDPDLFTHTITKLEQHSTGGKYCFTAGCVEPGCDNVNSPIRRILAEIEKH